MRLDELYCQSMIEAVRIYDSESLKLWKYDWRIENSGPDRMVECERAEALEHACTICKVPIEQATEFGCKQIDFEMLHSGRKS